MSLNSLAYFAFLGTSLLVYFLTPKNYKKYIVLLASFLFIGIGSLDSLVVLIILSTSTYFIAKKLSNTPINRVRKLHYFSGLALNCLAILLFKYLENGFEGYETFFKESSTHHFFLLLGLSFYCLQNIGFLIEKYFNRFKEEISLIDFFFFNAFFPKLIAGPICQPHELLPQIGRVEVKKDQIIAGFQRILLGLVKKMVIADRIAPGVHEIFDIDGPGNGITALFTAFLFTIQLYFDFSGYTDIAIGSAKLFGYNIKENFNLPLRATSIRDFWRKWHISLTSWLTKYIYYPISFHLRDNPVSSVILGILITFFLSGLWHGFGITFLIYAISHALFIIIELYLEKRNWSIARILPPTISRFISGLLTFSLVSFSLVFFRSASLHEAFSYFAVLFDLTHFIPKDFLYEVIAPLALGGDQESLFNFYVTIALVLIFLLLEKRIERLFHSSELKIPIIVGAILVLFIFGIVESTEQFIYTQF
jgi:alginate O-acetyltransferase complex protein AlgI